MKRHKFFRSLPCTYCQSIGSTIEQLVAMGGGAAMRAAAKVAGVAVVNSGIRGGFSAVPLPAEQSVRSASRPVSAILSSSQTEKAAVVDMEGEQRPAWDIDDWEFAGLEEDQHLLETIEPMPRVVFGPAPTLQEAKEATSDLKDALENLNPFGGGQLSGLSLLTNSDYLVTESCISCDPRAPSAPNAVRAFELLNKSPEVQGIVASIASDPNVWNAVLQNETLQGFFQTQRTKPGVDAHVQDPDSPTGFTELSDETSRVGNVENRAMDIFENIKNTVVEMANNVSNFVQNIFGFSAENSSSAGSEKNTELSFFNNALGASFMALAMMVIMVVILKRG